LNRKILVTGAGGFIGRAVVEKLTEASNFEIYAAVSGRREIAFPKGVHIERLDLMNHDKRCEALSRIKPQVLMHFAWNVGKSDFINSPDNLTWVEISLHLLRLFIENGGEHFLFAGSSSEYGDTRGLSEFSNFAPKCLYGSCKAVFNDIARTFSASRGIRYTGIRYFSVYGERDIRPGRAIPSIIKAILRREPVICKSPYNIWDYIYIEDAAEATLRILEKNYTGIINVGSGIPHPMREVFKLIAKKMAGENLLRFDESNRDKIVLVANVAVLRDKVGFSGRFDFNLGMDKTIAWWKANEENCPGNSS
jgi:nucleoside-diphosphate-sugar epimerase